MSGNDTAHRDNYCIFTALPDRLDRTRLIYLSKRSLDKVRKDDLIIYFYGLDAFERYYLPQFAKSVRKFKILDIQSVYKTSAVAEVDGCHSRALCLKLYYAG